MKAYGLVRLTRDPELKVIPGKEMMVAEFGVAWNRKVKGEDQPNFLECIAWNKMAEVATEHLRKGSQIAITNADLYMESWEKEGKKFSKMKLNVNQFEFVGGKNE